MEERGGSFRRPPPGFTLRQWQVFQERGILVIEDAFSEIELMAWQAAVLRLQDSARTDNPRAEATGANATGTGATGTGATCVNATGKDGFFTRRNFVETDPVFASLIDHPAYLGLVYDLYGEMLKLQLSELFVRSPGGGASPERWHIDGPRVLPYAVFAPGAPMQVKVGIWLTDVLQPEMGNLAFVPGSHRSQYFGAYDTDEVAAGEEQLLVRRGALTLMDTALWHRTVPNNSGIARVNLYLGYSPSWLPTSDRNTSDPVWLAGLNREQRIIMRSYANAHSHAKPPLEDYPLFLDRDTGLDREAGRYRDHLRLFHRKRVTAWEQFQSARAESVTSDVTTPGVTTSCIAASGVMPPEIVPEK
jgi:ectoine hydroxylase-related dioxygenase (phytanoyl-CoA dioxygenase family)